MYAVLTSASLRVALLRKSIVCRVESNESRLVVHRRISPYDVDRVRRHGGLWGWAEDHAAALWLGSGPFLTGDLKV